MRKIHANGVTRDATPEEETWLDALQTTYTNDAPNRKIAEIRKIRLTKLQETDYLANSDVTMPDNIKTWRQSLRDLPQNNTTESEYDALLARDDDGNLTNSIWSKP